jgi:hypothetical protein
MTLTSESTQLNAYRAPTAKGNVVLLDPLKCDTVAILSTPNGEYYYVTVVEKAGWMTMGRKVGVSAQVWFDDVAERWVVDYHDGELYIEVTTTRALEAALSAAVTNASLRGEAAGRW